MSNENLEAGTVPESEKTEKKVFDEKDFGGKSHEDQIKLLDDAMSQLDLMSGDIKNSVGEVEIDRVGRSQVVEKSSLFDKIKLGAFELFHDRPGYNDQLAKTAQKEAEKNLDGLERGLGADVVTLKEKIAAHEADSKNDLDIIKKLSDMPGLTDDIKTKMEQEAGAMKMKTEKERDLLKVEMDKKELDLQNKVREYPASQKQEKLTGLLDEYGQIEKTVVDKRRNLEASIKDFETACDQVKSPETKKVLAAQLEVLKKQGEKIAGKEKEIKERIDRLKASQKDLDPFTKKLNNLGKTAAEIEAENQAKMKPTKNVNTTEQPTAPLSNPGEKSQLNFDNTKKNPETNLEDIEKSAEEWAENIREIALNLVGKDIVANFKKKTMIGNIDSLKATHMLAEFLVEKRKIEKLDDATKKAKEIIGKIVK